MKQNPELLAYIYWLVYRLNIKGGYQATVLHCQSHNPNIILKKYLYRKETFENKQSAIVLPKLVFLICIN